MRHAERNPASEHAQRSHHAAVPLWHYLAAGLLVGVTSALAASLRSLLSVPDLEVLYFLAVLLAAVRFGRRPAILAAALAVLAYDFFFVPPYLTLHVHDARYLFTFGMMFAGGLLVSELAARIRQQQHEAMLREERTAALYALSRELGAARDAGDAAVAVARQAAQVFGGSAFVLRPGAAKELEIVARHPEHAPQATSDAVAAPVVLRDERLGVILLERGPSAPLRDEQRELLQAFADQAALAFERARLAEEARAAALRVETEQMRGSLLSAVSHDLRTPLASITGAATSLRDDGALSEAVRRELLDAICDEAERLERLVANLLDMTRIDSGAVVLKRDWVPLEEMVGSAFTRLEHRLGQRPVTVDLPADLPLLFVDPLLIEQVFVNLIENAAKYTPPGSPIEVCAAVEGEQVRVDVLDRGPGLPSGAEERLFEKFYRGSHVGVRGIGLGLAICRWIIQAHGGRIHAEKRAGGGATFRLTIPLTKPLPALTPEGQEET